jgi:hypothetical protein
MTGVNSRGHTGRRCPIIASHVSVLRRPSALLACLILIIRPNQCRRAAMKLPSVGDR